MKQRLSFVLITMFLAFLGWGGSLRAQSPRTIELGPYGGMAMTINDINTVNFFSEPGYEYGGLIRYNHDSRWAFRINYAHSMIQSTDTIAGWRPEREKSFRAIINDVSLMFEFNFLDFYTGRIGSTVSPYLFGGISRFTYKTAPLLSREQQIEFAGDSVPQNLKAFNQAWQSMNTGVSYSIPFGFGCKFSISEHLATSIEWRMHYTLTDRLDGLDSLYQGVDNHYFATVKSKDRHDTDGTVMKDKNGNVLKEYEVNIVQGGNPAGGYDLTDQTGLFKEYQQMSNSQSMDWFGSITISLTWKIPLPGGGACRVNSY